MSQQPNRQPARKAPGRPFARSADKPFAGPEFAREIDLTVKEQSNQADTDATHGASPMTKPGRQCVVGKCTGPKTPNAQICSAHAMAFHRDGTPRSTGANQSVGMVAAAKDYHRANGQRIEL